VTPAHVNRPKPNRSGREQEPVMRRPSPRSHKQDRGRQKSRQAAEWTAEPEENAHVGLLAVPGMGPTAEKTILTTLSPVPR
jgi:hypothetical protein